MVGDGGEQLHVRRPDAARLARRHGEHAEHLALDPERHQDHGAHAEGAGAGHIDGLVGRLDVVHDERETGHGDPGRARPGVVERELHGPEPRLGLDTPRRPVTADDAPARVHDEQIGALVAHGVDQALQRLLVDLLHVQRRADGGGQLAQQGELLDRRLEVAELLLELVVRVQDLLGLQIQHPLRVLPSGALEQRVADRPPRSRGRGRDDGLGHPRHRMGRGEPRRQGAGGAGPEQRRDPEPPAQRRVPPAHVDDARVRATRRALSLDDAWRAAAPSWSGTAPSLTFSQMQNHRGMT